MYIHKKIKKGKKYAKTISKQALVEDMKTEKQINVYLDIAQEYEVGSVLAYQDTTLEVITDHGISFGRFTKKANV
jgi:general stress protein 26